jgi:uncharacterized protein YcbX
LRSQDSKIIMTHFGHVSNIIVYPIKGCVSRTTHILQLMSIALTTPPNPLQQGGIPVTQAVATPTGLLLDRNFAIVTAGTCKIISQTQYPRLSSITVSISDPGLLSGELPFESAFDTNLIVSAPWLSDKLQIPLYPSDNPKLSIVESQDWSGLAVDCNRVAAEWFSRALGTPVRLIRYGGTFSSPLSARDDPLRRPVAPEYCPDGRPHETAFSSSGFPYTIVNKASLREYHRCFMGNKQQQHLVTYTPASSSIIEQQTASFRPNIVVDGKLLGMFEEDDWASVTIGTNMNSPNHQHQHYHQYYTHGDVDLSSCWEGGITLDMCKPHVCPYQSVVEQQDDGYDEKGSTNSSSSSNSSMQIFKKCRSGSQLRWKGDSGTTYFGWNAVSPFVGLIKVGDIVIPSFREQEVEGGGVGGKKAKGRPWEVEKEQQGKGE